MESPNYILYPKDPPEVDGMTLGSLIPYVPRSMLGLFNNIKDKLMVELFFVLIFPTASVLYG